MVAPTEVLKGREEILEVAAGRARSRPIDQAEAARGAKRSLSLSWTAAILLFWGGDAGECSLKYPTRASRSPTPSTRSLPSEKPQNSSSKESRGWIIHISLYLFNLAYSLTGEPGVPRRDGGGIFGAGGLGVEPPGLRMERRI